MNLLFHCCRHCSVQKIRPEFLKAWFLKVGLYCNASIETVTVLFLISALASVPERISLLPNE